VGVMGADIFMQRLGLGSKIGGSQLDSCPPSLFRLPFLRKSKLVARKQGHFEIRDSQCGIGIKVAGFSLLVPSLPIPYFFNQQPGTSNQVRFFHSAF
jgi:hypothetical protein